MTKEQLDAEIEYARSNRLKKELIRPFDAIRNTIVAVTNTYTILTEFFNDYVDLYLNEVITRKMYVNALNNLYLLALLHTGYEDFEEDENDFI